MLLLIYMIIYCWERNINDRRGNRVFKIQFEGRKGNKIPVEREQDRLETRFRVEFRFSSIPNMIIFL